MIRARAKMSQQSIVYEKIVDASVCVMDIGEGGEYLLITKFESPNVRNTIVRYEIIDNFCRFGEGLGLA